MLRDPVVPPTPDALYPRRLAARALALVLDQLGLGGPASRRFDPDDLRQVFVGPGEGEWRFWTSPNHYREPAATVFLDLERQQARVVIEVLWDVIRTGHRKEFRLSDVGIVPQPHLPDVDVEVSLQEVIAQEGELLRTAPYRPPLRRPRSTRWST